MAKLALDIGQTRIRARVSDSHTVSDHELAGFSYGGDLIEVIVQAVERFSTGVPFTVVSCGCTGVYGSPPELSRERFRRLASRVVIADDAVTSYLACLGAEPGVVAAAGTGLVVLGLSGTNARRVDGRGAFLGDEGSGWWIGRRAVIEELTASESGRSHDGCLRRYLEEEVGPLESLPQRLATDRNPAALVASLAAPTALAARDGNPVALGVYHQAAGLIAESIVAAATDIPCDSALSWAVVGGIGQAMDLLEPALSHQIRKSYPHAVRHTGSGPGIDGAVMLGNMPNVSLFGTLVSVCELKETP